MIVGHGVDVVDLERVRRLLAALEDDFLLGTFTRAERAVDCQPHERAPYFAGRLAAKEAVVKALGTGFTSELSWQQVEVLRGGDGRPELRLTGAARAEADRLGIDTWFVSISHTDGVAFASAIAVRGAASPYPR